MALGALDYSLMQLRVPAYLALFPDEQVVFAEGLPGWADGLWAVGVWAGLLGALFLALDIRRSAAVLGLAALAMLLAALYMIFLASPTIQEAAGEQAFWLLVAATGVSILLWIYARALHAAGAIS